MTNDQIQRAVKALERIADALDAFHERIETDSGLPIQVFGGATVDALRVVLVNGAAADLEPGQERGY